MVDLINHCSTYSVTGVDAAVLQRIRQGTASQDTQTFQAADAPRRKWTRLNAEARAAVVERYSAGEPSTKLAAEYGVAKSTILSVLRANNVVVRRQAITPEQVAEAVRLYTDEELSLSQVAARLPVNQETIRLALLKVGVTLRPPTGGISTM
ncbi:hypothetical protein EG850_12325 [Gulosibacter macacae]|uniref:Uncharacterized protein n=1 Tax=Gulosibacter macacae TaxID=2488791 RepID=A0A3P3VSD1_9MICO|nr:hypothetical protein [Gulosibacter macacae]RRJ85702.1 hypothetical protein EG850_12325 [Gulosibacter macacae]